MARFQPKPDANGAMFTVYRPDETEQGRFINSLFQDRDGRIWVATGNGVFQLMESAGEWTFRHLDLGPIGVMGPTLFAEDHAGNLWVTLAGYGTSALCRRQADGQIEIFRDPFLTKNVITSIFVDAENRIWVGTYFGLALLSTQPTHSRKLLARIFRKADGLPADHVGSMFQSSDGRLWVGSGGLLEVIGSGSKVKFKVYGNLDQGFMAINVEDASGNFWMANVRLAAHSFVNFGTADGLKTNDIRSIFEGHDGQLYVVTQTHSRYIHRFDGKGFVGVSPLVPGHGPSSDWWGIWGWGQTHFQDHLGAWWFASGSGLIRYPKVQRLEDLARTPPIAFYTSRDGLDGSETFRLYEDSRGDIWVSAWGGAGLTRWERATGRFHRVTGEGWKYGIPTAFREDQAGNVWIGCWEHDLIRYRHGQFEAFRLADGFPDGSVLSLFLDHAGRMWAATTRGGLVRIDNPGEDKPQFRVYTTKDGLSSNDVRAITEDRWGRIYFWTGVGIDRLEPETGALLHYTKSDGIPGSGSDNQEAFCDRNGRLWFGFAGLARLDPQPEAAASPQLPVYIRRIRVRGVAVPVSELGETQLAGLVFQPTQNSLQIEFSGLNFSMGEVLRYQYKLDGTNQEWSAPSDLRTVNYAELRPGSYRFLVRGINARGQVSASPAVFEFRMLAPVWARWWFLSLVAALIAFVAYQLYQYRVNSLLELERVRTRIASDLHDDVGSGLSQIAILMEVAKQAETTSSNRELLSRVADLSRELVDAMADIVWAMNPQRDKVADVVQRMRRFASDVLASRGIAFEFRTPDSDLDLPLRSDVRRDLYLVFKEGINNIVRHSGSTRVSIALSADKSEMRLHLQDNGRGLPSGNGGEGPGAGRGLASMKERAAALGGTLEITSSPDEGTGLFLRVPLVHRTFSAKNTT